MKFKKSVFLFLFIIVFTSSIFSQDQQIIQVDKAYACFEESLGDNCGNTKSTKQNAFNLLAASYNSNLQADCKTSLKQKLKGDCWGETDTGSCNIKSTALAILALDHVNEETDKYNSWLLSKRILETSLTWYLEIDSTNKTECTINGNKVIIDDNKKIIGASPSGLAKSYNDYWFEIKDKNRNYSITCDKDFITTLLFQKPDSSTYHVSSETKSAYEFDTIVEKVNSYCFSTSNICDYEGSLWAVLTLAKTGEDISSYIPYLTAMSDKTENKKYIPSAFLYLLTHSDDYYNELISLQKGNSYWDESNNKFYDTAVALFALRGISSDEIEASKRYILSNQKESGCWQSDTSFILHAAWPRSQSISGGGASISYCEDFGNYCVSIGECNFQDTLTNFYCPSSSEVCCKKDFIDPTCSEKTGIVCNLDETCDGDNVLASDTNECCIGNCVLINIEPECEIQGNICKSSCSELEEEKVGLSNSCDFGSVCCGRKPVEEKKTNYLLIILLIILIILVILAIIFRNQLRVWFFRFRSGYKTKPGKPPAPPAGFSPQPPIIRRPQFQPTQRYPQRRGPEKDKDFEETMKKIREMSK